MSYEGLIGAQDLQANLGRDDWVVFDCRFDLKDPGAGRLAFARGHIPSAHYADLERDLSGPVAHGTGRHPLPDPGEFGLFLTGCGVTSTTQVVAYDDHGGAYAARLWWLLRWLGHGPVAVLDGGLSAWEAGGCAYGVQVPARRGQTPGPAYGTPDDSRWLGTQALSKSLSLGEICLLDAREAERFRGESEPIDPVAGHIPGAQNAPYRDNLDASGCFLKPSALKAHFEAGLAGRAPSQVVHMCGSGVTACHNILAMELAGMSGSRLYPGSWSAWIADPRRPIALGGE